MTPEFFRVFLRGMLMGLARGPVDDAVIDMIMANLPTVGALQRDTVPLPVGYIPPDQIRALPRGVGGTGIARPMRNVDESPADAVDGPKSVAAAPAPVRGPKPKKTRGHVTPVGTDANLKDALSGGEVMRVG